MGEPLVQASLCTWRAAHWTKAVAALVHEQACLNFQTPTTTLSSERDY